MGHDWSVWSVTKPITEDAEGEETPACKNDANHTETRTIAKLTYERGKALWRLSMVSELLPRPTG